jgi:hypothetical protein
MFKMHEQNDELYDVLTCCMKFLKYDPFEHRIESICNMMPSQAP